MLVVGVGRLAMRRRLPPSAVTRVVDVDPSLLELASELLREDVVGSALAGMPPVRCARFSRKLLRVKLRKVGAVAFAARQNPE